MRNSAVLALSCICFFASASAIPIFEEPANYRDELLAAWEPVDQIFPVESERFKRATCDLLSISIPLGSLNHSACAAHCLAKRYKGGYCQDGVCRCRR